MEEEINFDVAYGLYDTQDNVWLGDDSGPRTFTDYGIARVVAQMADMQLGQRVGRTRAKEYEDGPKRLRDEVDVKMSPLQALQRLESGYMH